MNGYHSRLLRVPAYAVNRSKRLIETPKLYWGDVGLALHLAGLAEPTGPHLENLVLHDLLCWRDARVEGAEILYWRTAPGEEVDPLVKDASCRAKAFLPVCER
jgi:predicted AAA+ superfamily ATPase